MNHLLIHSRCAVALAVFSLAFSRGAQAQHDSAPTGGQHAYGVNRRVETGSGIKGDTTGYGGISGTFSEPDMAADSVFNPTDSAPQFYLGLGCDTPDVQLDAGLVYEARLTYLGVADKKVGKWQSFINYEGSTPEQANGRDPDDSRKFWSVPRGSLGDRTVSVAVSEDGTMTLSVSGGTTDPQDVPVTEKLPVTSDVAKGLYVKRVTAMTQKGTYVLDNTWIKNSTFTIGTISAISVKDKKFQLIDRRPSLWDASISDGTGASPSGKDGQGNFIVNFPGSYKRTPAVPNPTLPSDYFSKPETVDISLLRPAARAKGHRAARGRRGHR